MREIVPFSFDELYFILVFTQVQGGDELLRNQKDKSPTIIISSDQKETIITSACLQSDKERSSIAAVNVIS